MIRRLNSSRILLTIVALMFVCAALYAESHSSAPEPPAAAVTPTVEAMIAAILFLLTWGGQLYGFIWAARKNRQEQDEYAAKAAKLALLSELDDEEVTKKLAQAREIWVHSESGQRALRSALTPLIDTAVDTAVKEHDEMLYAHAPAFARVPNLDQFQGAIVRIELMIRGIEAQGAAAERQRAEDIRGLRDDVRQAAKDMKIEFNELRRNVARALGKRVEE